MIKEITKSDPMESALTAYKITDITMEGISEFRKAEKIDCVDAKSRQILGKHRKDIISIITQIETKRKDNNRDYQSKNNGHAVLLKDILTLSRGVFDTKIKDYDSIAEKKKAEKDLKIKEAAEKTQKLIDKLEANCKAGQAHNLTSIEIMLHVEDLQAIEISEADFGDSFGYAEMTLKEGLESTMDNFDSTVIFEKEQLEQTRIKAEQEKKAKELEEKEAQLKAAQDKADRKAKEEKAALAKKAEAEAKILRLATKKLEDDKLALQKEKDDLAAEKKARQDKQKALNEFNRCHAEAIETHELYLAALDDEIDSLIADADSRWKAGEKDRKAQAMKDKKYAKEIKADKKILQKILAGIDESVNYPGYSLCKTLAAEQIELYLVKDIKAAIEKADQAIENL